MEGMLISYGKGVIESSLGRLGSMIWNEALSIGSVREDILFIRDELQSMNAVMNDMIRAGSLNDQNKVWMLHVLQVACDAELCMDMFADCCSKPRQPGVFGASLHAGNFVRTIYPRHVIAKKIQNLKVQAMEVSQRHSRYAIAIPTKVTDTTKSDLGAAIEKSCGMHFSHVLPEDALAGNRYFEELRNKLKGDSFKVIAIVGPAGSGKTALAKVAYRRRNELEECFDKSAWVTLTENPDKNKVLEDILIQVGGSYKGMEHYEGDKLTKELTTKLKSELAGKSYLIVLDSVWKKEDWKAIEEALITENPDGGNPQGTKPEGGNPQGANPKRRVVLTTRKQDMATNEENTIQLKFIRKDAVRLCRLMVLNIASMWWDTMLEWVNPIINRIKEDGLVFLLLILLVIVPLGGLRLVIHCLFHPINTIIVAGTVTLLILFLWICGPLALTILALFIICPTLFMYNLFIWLNKKISNLLQWGGYFHQSNVNGVPMNKRFYIYLRLCNEQKAIFESVPLAVKFLCGAVVAKITRPHIGDDILKDLVLYKIKEQQGPVEEAQQISAGEEDQLGAIREAHDQLTDGQEAQLEAVEEVQQRDGQEAQLGAAEQAQLRDRQEALQRAKKDAPRIAKQVEEELKHVIGFCYEILCHNLDLKNCAEDLNILPEGYAIRRKRLMRRWVYLDLINAAPGLSIEHVAESYFHELTVRGFIDVESLNPCGNVKLCRINSAFKEYLMKDRKQTSPHDINKNPSFQLYDVQPSRTLECVKKAFSFPQRRTVYSGWENMIKKKSSSPNKAGTVLQLNSLTILDLEGCNGLSKEDLRFLSRCATLKFLSVRNTDLTDIPKEIGQLKKLETLDVRQTPIACLPKDILCLLSLKHIWAGCIGKPESSTSGLKRCLNSIKVPDGMEAMSRLETLAHVEATRPLLLGLRDWAQLKKLGLVIPKGKLNPKPLCISIMMLSASLLSLSILNEDGTKSLGFLEYLCFAPLNLKSLKLKGRLERLPQWISDHKRLTKLIIADTDLRSNAIRLIGKIPTLLCLKLYEKSIQGDTLTLEKEEFPVLQVLIIHCDNIQKVCFQKYTAPSLKVFRWVFSKEEEKECHVNCKLPMLKEVSLIGAVYRDQERIMKEAFKDHAEPLFETIKNLE